MAWWMLQVVVQSSSILVQKCILAQYDSSWTILLVPLVCCSRGKSWWYLSSVCNLETLFLCNLVLMKFLLASQSMVEACEDLSETCSSSPDMLHLDY